MCLVCKVAARCILVICNIIFIICGAAFLFIGVVAIMGSHTMTQLLKSSHPDYELVSSVTSVPDLLIGPAVFMIIVGAIMMLVALIGFIGASLLMRILLIVYAILVGAMLIAEIALIVFVMLLPGRYDEEGQKLLYQSLKDNYNGSVGIDQMMDPASGHVAAENVPKVPWLMLEIKFSCCGAHNYTDYKTIDWNRTMTLETMTVQAEVPFSCCKNPKERVNLTNCLKGDVEEINTQGCYSAVTKLVWDFCHMALSFAIISIVVQSFLLGASLLLICYK